MNTPGVKVTLLVGSALAAVLAFLVGWRRKKLRPEELGPISEQWIADHKRDLDSSW